MKIKNKLAVLSDYSIWFILGLFVLVIGSVIIYIAIKKGTINMDSIKNFFRFGIK